MMTTRCPQCGAAFRVAADQLRVRNGLVRCGNCRAIFDGYDSLVGPTQAQAPLRRLPPAVLRNRADLLRQSHEQARVGLPAEPEPRLAPPPDPYAAPEAAAGPPPNAPSPDDAPLVWRRRGALGERLDRADDDEPPPLVAPIAIGATADDPTGWVVRGETRTRQRDASDATDARDASDMPPPFLDDEWLARRQRSRTLWGVGVLLGLALLLLQGVMVYRTQLALAAPALRPALTALCEPLGCRVGYARRAERISIMSSALQRPSAGAPENAALVLHVVLRNRYHQPQEWPALMLSLTDLSDTVIARRVLRPFEYLPPLQADGALSAGQEVSLAIPIDAGKLSVNGYQLDKFFP